MAVRIVQTVVDDLDGSTTNVHTYRFAYDGVDYEIDLSEANIDTFRAALYPFIAAARRQPRTPAKARTAQRRTDHSTIRAWWAAQQDTTLPPATHGRIPVEVHAAYRRATTRTHLL